ncbi:MAG: sulfatase-like hydrolase/transferase [Treponema sp.]|nr:sulfatase-like hydrolase/transferase [Treponema sp.]
MKNKQREKPNVIFIYGDDLGRGMLSCYGQKKFSTPNIDRLAAAGMQFSNAHGCHICAPARASLLCGIHDCHAGRWTFTKAGVYIDYARGLLPLEDVYELIHNTGIEQRSEDIFLPMVFKQAGYVTGQIGKLEWGFATTGEEIQRHGWDYHYGYYDHQMCHGYYPPFMFENNKRIDIEGNTDPHCGKGYGRKHPKYNEYHWDRSDKKVYSQDLFDEKIVSFIKANRDRPFFLYHPSQLPHGVLAVPEISPEVADNPALTGMEKEYASMVIRLDRTVGLIQETLEDFGIAENTMLIFTADNGHSFYYGYERTGNDSPAVNGREVDNLNVLYTSETVGDIFDGNNSMTGCKASNFEGGVRIPLVISWPGHISAGSKTDTLVANYDFMATMAGMLGTDAGKYKDSLSYLPVLLGDEKNFRGHDYIVYASENGPAILTKDGWKFRTHIYENFNFDVFGAYWHQVKDKISFTLHNVINDYREENNLIDEQPDIARKLKQLLLKECDGNFIHGTTQPHFAFYTDDIAAVNEKQA